MFFFSKKTPKNDWNQPTKWPKSDCSWGLEDFFFKKHGTLRDNFQKGKKVPSEPKNRKKWQKSRKKDDQDQILCHQRFFLFKNIGVWDVICKKGKKGPQIILKNDQNIPKI